MGHHLQTTTMKTVNAITTSAIKDMYEDLLSGNDQKMIQIYILDLEGGK